MQNRQTLISISMLFTILATIGGILTLIPWAGASYPNVLGYKSLCTFAPTATLACFFLAGLSCFLRATFLKETEGSLREKFRRHAHSLAPLGLLLVLFIASMIWFLAVKAQYIDAGSAASALI
mgnify:CR=1 FL=1|jgi:hypothetical protein